MQSHIKLNAISRIRLFRQWEKANLPLYGTQAGSELFLLLASSLISNKMTLKEIYLSMSCAESTTRLLFRNLESDGWIVLPRDQSDSRFKEFQLTEKFHNIIADWCDLYSMSASLSAVSGTVDV